MALNKLQIQAIKDKAGYKSTDYCNVSAEQVKQFLLDQQVPLGNKKKKETLLQVIWESEELTQQFGETFFNDFYCNIYDLINSYHISWEEAQGLIEGGLVEATGDLSKKGYPLLSLNALKFSRDEIRALYDSHFGGNIIKVRLEVDNKEQGSAVTDRLAQLFDVGELNYHSRRDDNRLHLYTTLLPKNSVSEAYQMSENARLKQELAEMQLRLAEANKQLIDFKTVLNARELTVEDMDKYQRLQDRYNNLVKNRSEEHIELISARLKLELVTKRLELKIEEVEELEEKLKKATHKKPPKFSDEEQVEIVEQYKSGMTMQQLATEYSCSVGLIHKVIKAGAEV